MTGFGKRQIFDGFSLKICIQGIESLQFLITNEFIFGQFHKNFQHPIFELLRFGIW
jgi:hypothetical protein